VVVGNLSVSPAVATQPVPVEPTRPSVNATEGARALAAELGLDLSSFLGTGKDGTVTVADIRRSQKGGSA
jgi:pyruvate/2-oxoglutarate dehydrogenase complex dihydrolipoamide acyltransferase (E2) component